MGKRLANENFGFVQDVIEDPQKSKGKSDFGFVPDTPSKKKADLGESSPSGLDLSPAANYRQSLKDFNTKAEELNAVQNDMLDYKKLIDDHDVLQQDERQLDIFKQNTQKYNELVADNNKRAKELSRLKVLLDQGKKDYDEDNLSRQEKLFNDLNLTKQERQQLRNQVYKQLHPERAGDIDAGKFLPYGLDIDAEDLAKSLTGKTLDQLERRKQFEKNRPISDRIFGTFSRSVQKTLAFELPAAAGGAINNLMAEAKITDAELNTSVFKPGVVQMKKLINLVPGARQAINEKVDDARVAVFNWADEWRKQPTAVIPMNGVYTVFANDQNLIRSISQINKPLDAIDFVFSSAGQGAAQIIPSILTRGTTSFIQEIGNNQLDGTIEIAKQLSEKEGRTVTPEEVIRKDLDEPVTARNFGIIQGGLDALSAGKVAKSLGYDQVKKDLKQRAMRWFEEARKAGQNEFFTESAQSALAQSAIGKMTGLGTIEAVKKINWFQVLDEGIAGAIGGAAVTSGGAAVNEAASRIGNLSQLQKKDRNDQEEAAYQEMMDEVAATAIDKGDPRSPESIKNFVEEEVLPNVKVPVSGPIEVVEPSTPSASELQFKPDSPGPEAISEYQAVNQTEKYEPTEKERVIATQLGRFSKESFARWGDPNFIKDTPVARMMYLSKKGRDIDSQAKEMSEILNPDGDGTEITPQDIVDFVMRFPKGKRHFNSLTKEDTDEIAEQALDEVADEYFDKKPGLRYALESIMRFGLTPENLQSSEVQEYLNNSFLFSQEDKDNINTIFEYAKEEGLNELNQLLVEVNQRVGEEFAKERAFPEVQTEIGSEEAKINTAGYPTSWGAPTQADNPETKANPPTEEQKPVNQKSGAIVPRPPSLKNIHTDPALDDIKEVLAKGKKISIDNEGKITVKQNSGYASQLFSDLEQITGDKTAALNEYLKIKQDSGEFKKKYGDWENQIMKEFGRAGLEYTVKVGRPKNADPNAYVWSHTDENGNPVIVFNLDKVRRDENFNEVKKEYFDQVVEKEIGTPEQRRIYGDLYNKVIDKLRDLKLHLIHEVLIAEKDARNVTIEDRMRSLTEIQRLNGIELAKDYYGEPMIYMHSGPKGIKKFLKPGDKGYVQSDIMTGSAGIYFTRNPKGAKYYAEFGKDKEGQPVKGRDIYYAFLRAKNPYYMTDPRARADYSLESSETISKRDVDALKKKGYDAVIWDKESAPKQEAVVFEPDQVEIIGTFREGLTTVEPSNPPNKDEASNNKPRRVKKSGKIKSELDDLIKQLDQTLGNSLSTIINPEATIIGARIIGKYMELGVTKFSEIAQDVYEEYGEAAFRKFFQSLKAGYGSVLATSDDLNLTSLEEVKKAQADDFVQPKIEANDTGTAGDLESDSPRNGTDEQVGDQDVSDERTADREGARKRSQGTAKPGMGIQGDLGFSDRIPTVSGERPDPRMDQNERSEPVDERVEGRELGERSSGPDEPGLPSDLTTDTEPAKVVSKQVAKRLSFEEKVKLQERANRNVAIVPKDKKNIAESLPLLLEHQVENVHKAETRFLNPPDTPDGVNKGIMFTDGTGTGKTFTGLGISKRGERMGIKDQLFVVPTDAKVKDWIDEGKYFGLDLYQLKDTKDAGREGQMVITTYANFRQNPALLARAAKKPFGLVFYDESHKIVSNQGGDYTEADRIHKQLTNSPNQAWLKGKAKYQTMYDKAYGKDGSYDQQQKVNALISEEAKRLADATKVVFLSASPFSYHKNLEYADGYLFTIMEGEKFEGGKSYKNFFIQNFGYRIRYNKLTEPEASVDVGLMERAFHTRMVKAGSVSSTRLQLDKDYSREFILMDSQLGMMIDEGYKIASDYKTYPLLSEVVRRKFSFLYESQLLEAIKAKLYVDRVQQHLDLGRKVVVFHSYNNSLPSHPFDFSDPILYPAGRRPADIQREIASFHKKYPQYKELDLRDLKNPIKTMVDAFGEKVTLFNGNISPKNRAEAKRLFNKEDSGVDVIVVQMEAGKEGLSLHDVVGKRQRVMVNVGLPVKPTDAIQTEGRIYRIGQMSDAVIEYPVLHLNFEKIAFANKINERAKTAENLAFGEQARNLKEAFKEGYKNPVTDTPSDKQGKGGRDSDLMFERIDEWDMSKTLYFGRQKRTAKTKALEGTDYYATPEPVGLKMVEWLYSKANDHLLEPSAGHGAIARWFPDNTVNKMIEPSYNLKSDLTINASGEVVPGNFEDFHIVNKFDGIPMNPPYGHASKTAWEHLEKAMGHLKNGGRVIAIVPEGPSMDKYLNKWLESKDSEDFFITAKISMPTVTFERAGTKVKTQILVIDKQIQDQVKKRMPQQRTVDLSNIEDIKELFSRLKDLDVPERLSPVEDAAKQVSANINATAPSADDLAQVVPGVHTKLGYQIFTVRFVKKVEYDQYSKANDRAKQLGGYYSSYNGNGAIRGFVFKESNNGRQNANKLLNFINQGFRDDDPGGGGGVDAYNMMSARKPNTTIGQFQGRPTNGQGQPFKLYNEVIQLAKKYNPNSTLGQGHNTRGATGTFYIPSRNTRVVGLNNLAVAMHELTHALDYRNNIIKDLISSTKTGDRVRNRLTELYLKYYPQARPNDDLRKRMVEGYATLVQKYLEVPNDINRDFKDLVDLFLTSGGKFWTDEVGYFLQDVEYIISQYQALDPLAKMGTRITNDVIDQSNESFLTTADKITMQTFDRLYPIEKLAKENGTHFTQDDISLWMRLSNNALQIAEKNISSKKQRFWQMDDNGQWQEKHKFNYYTLTKSLDKRGLQDEFAAYLYARRIKFEYDELNDQQQKLNTVQSPAYLNQVMQQMQVNMQTAQSIVNAEAQEMEREIGRLSSILENEGVTEQEANDAYSAGQQIFASDEKIYDALVAEDLEFAHNPAIQLLDDDGYSKFKSRTGYASFKRAWYDELVGPDAEVPKIQTAGKTKVSQFLTRKGSTKPVLNPLMGAMMNHSELIRKGLKQMVYNKFLNIAEKHPDLFQVLQLVTNPDATNRFPQERDPNIIMARKDYKRVPILADAQIKSVLDENYDYHNAHLLERVGVSMAQLFRTGTTGIFWQFFINNTFLDQIAASVNTRNGMFPFITSIRQVGPAVLNMASEKIWGRATLFPNSMEAAYLKEYLFLAGTSQTFLSADIQGIRNLKDIIKRENDSFGRRANRYFENILKFLSTPGNATEIMTRGTEYILARKAGKPQQVALEEAGRVSAPFHHMGKLGGGVGRSYVRTVPYFNASLQVLKQTKNSLNTKEGKVRYAFTALSMVAMAVGTTLYLLDQDDDDERLLLLKSLPPDNLTKYLFLPNPFSDQKLLQIRIPEQVGWLAGIFNMMLLEKRDQTNYRWSEYGEASMSFLPTQMNPFNPTQLLFSYIPQGLKPTIETITGVKTYPSIRPIETVRDKSLPEELRYSKYTSPGAIYLGEVLGWSPKKIDHFLEGTFGRSIKYLTGKPGAYGVGNLFERDLYLEASRQIQFYYETKQRVSQQIKAHEDGLKEYSAEEVQKMWAQDAVIAEIEGLILEYEDADDLRSAYYRNKVFERIRDLEDIIF